MTTKPQSVAQRVISEMEQQRGQFETEQEYVAAVRAGGRRVLHTELSAGARAMIDRLYDDEEQAEAGGMPGGIAVAESERLTLQAAFTRLGLNIDHDETEGE